MNNLGWIALALWETVGLVLVYWNGFRNNIRISGADSMGVGIAVVLAAFLWPLVVLHVYLKKHKQIDVMRNI